MLPSLPYSTIPLYITALTMIPIAVMGQCEALAYLLRSFRDDPDFRGSYARSAARWLRGSDSNRRPIG